MRLALEHDLGIEVQSFAYPSLLEDDWEGTLRHYLNALAPLAGPVAMHGPFLDMASGSLDPWINDVVRRRVSHALEIAERLGACTAVFHANFIASLRNPDYRIGWTERQIAFWAPLADRAWNAGIVIALENMWEFDPDIIGEVIRQVDHPGLQICLDVGHAHLFSDLPLDNWLAHLAPHIVHIHLNNNGGMIDQHRALDDGVIDYATVLPALRALPRTPLFSLEIERVTDLARSLPMLNLHE